MILLCVLILVGIALWYLAFILFGEFWRPDRKPNTRTTGPIESPTANRGHTVQAVSLGWTALDDQQLTRLLKGSAP